MMKRFGLMLAVMLALMVAAVTPALAQSDPNNTVWGAEFYNNTTLNEPIVTKAQLPYLGFDWGLGAPTQNVNADGWSARFAADPVFDTATYRFFIYADDHVKLFVNFPYQAQIDTFATGVIGQVLTADVQLTAGQHHVQVDYRDTGGNAYVFVTWVNLAKNPNPQPKFPGGGATQQSSSTTAGSTINNGMWVAQYYPNQTLTSPPTAIIGESLPSHDWGSGSPVASLAADNFSARWTSAQTMSGGAYVLTVKSDDGVRIYVDGALVIDQWHNADGGTYTTTVNLYAGVHNFTIEYYEAAGNAFMFFTIALPGSTPPSSGSGAAVVNTGVTATVTSAKLNVRDLPSVSGSTVLVKVSQNESYPVVGSNGDRTWWQINVNGVTGWVSSAFVQIVGNVNTVPVTNSTTAYSTVPTTGYTVTMSTKINVRSAPSTRNSTILAELPKGVLAQVIGRNADSTWWQVNYSGVTGWVSAQYAVLQSGASIKNIPVTG